MKKEIKEINTIQNESKDLIKMIDELEIDLIKKNEENEKIIKLYKMMLENIILEYHESCKKIYK